MSLFDNPLGRMYGPFFLILYALICLAAILYTRYKLPTRMSRSAEEPPKIPDKPDPYEIAYLWQTENELLVLIVFNLVRRKCLSLVQERTGILVKQNPTNMDMLNAMEKEVYKRFEKTCTLNTFVKDVHRDSLFRNLVEELDKELKEQDLLWCEHDVQEFRRRKTRIILLMILPGLYKVLAAIHHEHGNVLGIIIIFGVAALILKSIQVNKMTTVKGRKLHEQLKQIFRPVQGNMLLKQPAYMEQLLLGIYGFGLLKDSDYSTFYTCAAADLKLHAAVDFEGGRSGTCSASGCGSGCSGGSGCGGGCGGCGGCG